MKKIAGTGSYADSRGPADMSLDGAKKYKDYGWALNWDSTARFPVRPQTLTDGSSSTVSFLFYRPCLTPSRGEQWHGEWLPTAADGFGESWLTV